MDCRRCSGNSGPVRITLGSRKRGGIQDLWHSSASLSLESHAESQFHHPKRLGRVSDDMGKPVNASSFPWLENSTGPPDTSNEIAEVLVQKSKRLVQRQRANARNEKEEYFVRPNQTDVLLTSEEEESIWKLVSSINVSDLNLYSTHNTLASLSHLVQMQKSQNLVLALDPYIQTLWRHLEMHQAERYLCPRRWLECLQTATVLRLRYISPLYTKICERLTKGDSLARLKPHQLVQVLQWAWTTTRARHGRRSFGTDRPADYVEHCETQLVRLVAKRLRKQQMRQKTDNPTLSRAISGTCKLLKYQLIQKAKIQHSKSISLDSELKQLAYTLVKERTLRLARETQDDQNQGPNATTSSSSSSPLTSTEVASMFQCAQLVVVNRTDALVHQLSSVLENHTTMDYLSFSQCATIFEALVQWRAPPSSMAVQAMGQALLLHQLESESPVRPKDVSSILRGVALLCRSSSSWNDAVSPFRTLAEQLFREKEFLNTCSLRILSNFIWFGSILGLSEHAANILGNQVLQTLDRINVHMVSPKVAGRVLSSFTIWIVDRIEYTSGGERIASIRLRDLLVHSYDILGEYLMSNRLDPHDITSALLAYAKAGYTLDPTVIDHLAAALVVRLEECSVRQVAQSLWALAKIREWNLARDSPTISQRNPLYLSHIPSIVFYLSSHASQLSTADATQAIWAIAKLEAFNEPVHSLMQPLFERINNIKHLMSAQETANCLWALSKIPKKAYQTIFHLTQHLRNKEVFNTLEPQEATAILYALGRLDIREEWLFGQLSQVILSNVENTSSPAIAHILWAHKRVHLKPPKEILNAWTSKKLGIIPVSSMNDDWYDGELI